MVVNFFLSVFCLFSICMINYKQSTIQYTERKATTLFMWNQYYKRYRKSRITRDFSSNSNTTRCGNYHRYCTRSLLETFVWEIPFILCANISHVCSMTRLELTSAQRNYCPAIAKPCQPVVPAMWERPAATAVPIISWLNSQCAWSPQPANISTPPTPVPWMKPPEIWPSLVCVKPSPSSFHPWLSTSPYLGPRSSCLDF
jgi:hypothetical protein